MKRGILKFVAVAVIALVLTAAAHAGSVATVGQAAPGFSLIDSNGQTHRLADYRGKFVVLEWVNFDCPFVGKHYGSGNMQKLQKAYTARNVVWLSINSSAPGRQGNYPPDKVNALIKQKGGAATAYLLDTDGTVGRAYGAKTTPHMYVIDPGGMLLYAGGIDDKPSTDVADIATAKNFLSAAMDEALAGKAVTIKSHQPYGCSVKYSNESE